MEKDYSKIEADKKLPKWYKFVKEKISVVSGGFFALFLFFLFSTIFFAGNDYIQDKYFLLIDNFDDPFVFVLFLNYFLGSAPASIVIPLTVFITGSYFHNKIVFYSKNFLILVFVAFLIVSSYVETVLIFEYYNFKTKSWVDVIAMSSIALLWYVFIRIFDNKN